MSSTIEKTALAMMGTAATVAIYGESMKVVGRAIDHAYKPERKKRRR